MKKALLVLLLLTSISNYSNAARILGIGNSSCGQHNEYIAKNPNSWDHTSWVLGYLSGSNQETNKDFLAGTDAKAIRGALVLYCQNNPLDRVVDAALSIRSQLMDRAQ